MNIYKEFGIHIVNVTPVEIHDRKWLCVAFEEEGVNMGDMMHLAFLWVDELRLTDNLMNVAETMFLESSIPLLRIHSECLLGDALHSDLCDCGEQLTASFSNILSNEAGAILYLRQEGRGIGMREKLKCLAIQEGYIDGEKTVEPMSSDEANLFFGHKVDERDYTIVTKFLRALKISDVKMLTGNLDKIDAVKSTGIKVHGLSDINRSHIQYDSRKYRELLEKSKRRYNYSLNVESI